MYVTFFLLLFFIYEIRGWSHTLTLFRVLLYLVVPLVMVWQWQVMAFLVISTLHVVIRNGMEATPILLKPGLSWPHIVPGLAPPVVSLGRGPTNTKTKTPV